jgi:hypothetical protein
VAPRSSAARASSPFLSSVIEEGRWWLASSVKRRTVSCKRELQNALCFCTYILCRLYVLRSMDDGCFEVDLFRCLFSFFLCFFLGYFSVDFNLCSSILYANDRFFRWLGPFGCLRCIYDLQELSHVRYRIFFLILC